MTPEQVYQAWAPEGGRWSRWVKPVLFANMTPSLSLLSETQVDQAAYQWRDCSWAPPASGASAIVVDLPGESGTMLGLALAEAGYRPVPLYNAVTAPRRGLYEDSVTAVDVKPIIDALHSGAERLNELKLSSQAPPAFLLDSRRRDAAASLNPGVFDNRSVSLPTDFPSANFLLSSGVKNMLLVQTRAGQPQADLAHTLRRWQDGGLAISCIATNAPAEGDAGSPPAAREPAPTATEPQPLTVDRPQWYRHLWQGLLARMGLRRSPLGGFGGFIPVPSEGGGWSSG